MLQISDALTPNENHTIFFNLLFASVVERSAFFSSSSSFLFPSIDLLLKNDKVSSVISNCNSPYWVFLVKFIIFPILLKSEAKIYTSHQVLHSASFILHVLQFIQQSSAVSFPKHVVKLFGEAYMC